MKCGCLVILIAILSNANSTPGIYYLFFLNIEYTYMEKNNSKNFEQSWDIWTSLRLFNIQLLISYTMLKVE